MDGALVGAACDCGACADDPDAPVARGAKGCLRAGRDDALDWNLEKILHPRHGEGGGGVAGYNDHLGLLGEEEAADLDTVAFHGFPAFPPVRDARRVANVENRLGGEMLLESRCHREAANAGIEHANGVKARVARCVGFHSVFHLPGLIDQLSSSRILLFWKERPLQREIV